MSKFLSRKFIVTILVMICSVGAPLLYSKSGISDMVMLSVLAIVGGVGVAYGVVNVKDAKLDKEKAQSGD